MSRGLLKAFGAGVAATALGLGLMGGNQLEDAEYAVDLGLEKDGKAMMYVDGDIKAVDPEDASCADLDNCVGLQQFTHKTQEALAAASPDVLQEATGAYYAERRALTDILDHEIPDALAVVDPVKPSTDDLVFIRQGLGDVLNSYGSLQSSDSYEADPAHIQELTQLHDTLYNAEHAQQAYEMFKAGVQSYDGFTTEEKQQITSALSGEQEGPSTGKPQAPSF